MLKDSLVAYVLRAGGRVELGGEVGQAAGSGGFWFSLAGTARLDVEEADVGGLVRFAGQLRLFAHRGLLDVRVIDPWIAIQGASGRLSVQDRTDTRVEVADVRLPVPTCDGSTLMWTDARTTLAPTGTDLFGGHYRPGDDLAPVLVRIPWIVEARRVPARFTPCLVEMFETSASSAPRAAVRRRTERERRSSRRRRRRRGR